MLEIQIGGTGGLLIIYANSIENTGEIVAKGSDSIRAEYDNARGGSSGGGSINIFYKDEYLNRGSVNADGGTFGGIGGNGSISIGDISSGTCEIKNHLNPTNLIPTMTSNTTPSGKVEASGEWDIRPAWQAFRNVDVNINDGSTMWINKEVESWISYTWDSEVAIDSIEFYQWHPNDFTAQYLENGTWKDLFSVTAINDSDAYTKKNIKLNNRVSTNSIRFVITRCTKDWNWSILGGVKVYGINT